MEHLKELILGLNGIVLGTSSMAAVCGLIWIAPKLRVENALSALENLGKMGHREVARTYAACAGNFISAGGAGLITVITVAAKFLITHSPISLFASAILVAINFIASFVLMQASGFRLATKQAPLLGAALGRLWKEVRGDFTPTWISREATLSLRTQVLSAAGNLMIVAPAAVAFHFLFLWASGHAVLDPHAARAALESLHLWRTWTLAYAAFTGFLLWSCTFLGGLVASRTGYFSKSHATTMFNVLLGLALAFIPALGSGLGVPIDVRHFTLSGGTVAMAAASLGMQGALQAGLIQATLSVLVIGVLNFSVSFILGFLVSWASGGGLRRRSGAMAILR